MQDKTYSPGVMKYVEESKKLIAEREAQTAWAKTWKFDTIAVHGLYSVEEALARNQGAIIEPLYLASAQAYRDSDELEAALGALNEDQRVVVVLRFWQDLSLEQISERLGWPLGTVKSRLHHAMGAMKKRLERDAGHEIREVAP